MNTVYLCMLMFNPVFAEGDTGAKSMLRGPSWEDVAFAGPIVRWVIGIILAVVVIAAFVRGALLLLGLAGADRHKARAIGEGLLFCAVAIFAAMSFSDIFGSMIDSIRSS